MVKSLLKIPKALLLMMCLSLPATMMAETEEVLDSPIEMEQNQISIAVSGSTIRVKNADGLTIEFYSITGEKVYTQLVEGTSKVFDLGKLQRGYYLVKIGNFTRKIYLH
jgi:hypothetical protein